MSHSSAVVMRGAEILGYVEFNNTVAQVWTPIIRATMDEVEEHWRGPEGLSPEAWESCGCAGVEVEVVNDWEGCSWRTLACLEHRRIVGIFSPLEVP